MKSEFLVWGVLPVIVVVILCILSINLTRLQRRPLNYLLSALVLLLSLLVVAILITMFFFDGYPTILPHLIIVLAMILVGLQSLLNRFRIRNF